MELKKSQGVTAEKFLSQIEKSLEQQLDLRPIRAEIAITWKDIDDITTKKEICEAMKKQLSKIMKKLFCLIGNNKSPRFGCHFSRSFEPVSGDYLRTQKAQKANAGDASHAQ